MTNAFIQQKVDCGYILANPDIFAETNQDYFQASYWRDRGAITGQASGRDEVIFFLHNGVEWALKRYKRGGLLGKLVEESYLTFGLQHSRAYREFALLFQMQSLQLPCPNPGSALIETHGPFTRASLITRRIRGTRNLVNILQSQSMDAEIWQAIGQTVARFHQHNIYHSDLNAHNILIDSENNVFLIDFDKCEQRPDLGEKSIGWKQSNLDRLLRSLHKENSLHAGLHWDDSQWQLFLEGYRGPPRNAQTS